MDERRQDSVPQRNEEDAARAPATATYRAADDCQYEVSVCVRSAEHDSQAGVMTRRAVERSRESHDRVLAWRLGHLDLGFRRSAADSAMIRRRCHELPNEDTNTDDSDGASSTATCRYVSSSEPDDAQHDHEPDGSRSTSKRQRTDINTSSGSNGNASTHNHSRNHRNNGDRKSAEESDEGSDDNAHVRRTTTATTVQDKLEPQMPCFVPGCKGRDATLSHMFRGAETHHNFFFCKRCCSKVATKKEARDHGSSCHRHCISLSCPNAMRGQPDIWQRLRGIMLREHLENGETEDHALAAMKHIVPSLPPALIRKALDAMIRPHVWEDGCPDTFRTVPNLDVWQYLFKLHNPDTRVPFQVFASGIEVPHGAGRLRPTRRKGKARAASASTSVLSPGDRHDKQADERDDRCSEARLQQQLYDSELRSQRLHNILRYCVKLHAEASSGQLDLVLRGLLHTDAPELLDQYEHTGAVALGEKPVIIDESSTPRIEPEKQAEVSVQAKLATTIITSTLDDMRLQQPAVDRNMAYLLQRDPALLRSLEANIIHEKVSSIVTWIQHLQNSSDLLRGMLCGLPLAESTVVSSGWLFPPSSGELRPDLSGCWQDMAWDDSLWTAGIDFES